MAKSDSAELLSIDGREVRITNPEKPYFSRGVTLSKLDIVTYYLSVANGAIAGIRDRPLVLKRFVNGAEAEPFYQKRAPDKRPDWLKTVTLSFPSGRTAEEITVDDAAGLAWVVNLGCIELHPHAVRANDLDHPDELRIDLDPGPGVEWDDVRRIAMEAHALLHELGLTGWPKTSGSRGMHVNVRIEQRWTFTEVRRAALAFSREIERRMPTLATSKWWKEERHGVFLDYNQNAKDRTTCSAYSVRPLPDARVSTPLRWDEVLTCDPADFTVLTIPQRYAELGDPHAAMDDAPGSLEQLFEKPFRFDRDATNVVPLDARAGVEIDAQLVGMVEIIRADGVRMQLDAAEVHDPGEAGDIIDDDFFRGATRGKGQRDGSQPLGPVVRRALLVERLFLGAIHEALEHERAVAGAEIGRASCREKV